MSLRATDGLAETGLWGRPCKLEIEDVTGFIER
jgi:hypothetical protein